MFRRLGNLIRGFFSLFVSGLERDNADALLESEKENLREQIAKYNQGLASHAALCERLMGQIRKLEADERELRAKITANLKAGNRQPAAQYALRLQSVQSDLKENRLQAEEAEKTYKNLTLARDQSVREARRKIERLRAQLDDLKIKQATAEMNEMASGMVSEMGSSGETLNRLEEMIREEHERAAGRARVAQDAVELGDLELKEAEEKALADQALADFAAAEGIALESEEKPDSGRDEAEPPKTMGPVVE